MENRVFLTVLIVAVLALVTALFLPGGRAPDHTRMPWLISVAENGELTVFNLTLGKSTLKDARRELGDSGTVALYLKGDGKKVVEVYFERLFLSGIRSNMVLTLQLTPDMLEEMYMRGARISKAESGVRKVDLSGEDLATLEQRPITLITYLPYVDLEDEVIARRFGEPDQRIKEESGITHWLYPKRGLDIAMNPDGKDVFQYLPPERFDEVMAPLIKEKERLEAEQKVTE